MNTPQWILVGLYALNLIVYAAHDGELKEPQKYNFAAQLVGTAILFGLLYWGGFFSQV